MSIPMFWVATLVLFYPAQWWGYAPPVVYVSIFKDPVQNLKMFLVPGILGALTQAGMQLRFVRTQVLDTLRGRITSARRIRRASSSGPSCSATPSATP